MPSLAYLLWTRLNEVCSDGSNVWCNVIEPADASDHNMQDVLPTVDIMIGSAKDTGNAL